MTRPEDRGQHVGASRVLHLRNGAQGSSGTTWSQQLPAAGGAARPQPLINKSALVVSDETELLHKLIERLATRGADIALVSANLSGAGEARLGELVASLGCRFFMIHTGREDTAGLGRAVRHASQALGSLDFFVDLTRDGGEHRTANQGAPARDQVGEWGLVAALREIVGRPD